MTELTRRERVHLALKHQDVDRVPVDFGGRVSGIAVSTYDELKNKIGMGGKTEILDSRLQLARVDEEIMEKFSVDTKYICQKAAASWDPKWDYEKGTYVDEWGITLGKPSEGYYYDYINYPLFQAKGMDDLEKHPWPNVEDLSRNEGLIEEVEAVAKAKAPFVLTSYKGTFEQAWALRGLEQFLMDLACNREFVEALLDKVLDIQKKMYGPFLEALGPNLDMVCFTDDMGGQNELMISPQMYKEIVKPRHMEMVKFIREKTQGALVAFHCCGSVVKILPDMIDLGVEVLNPVQVTAAGMDIEFLKNTYGDKLSFWGGIDTQKMLPFGKPEEVREAVKTTCEVLGKGGGYLLAPCHCIQAKTPVENILALFER